MFFTSCYKQKELQNVETQELTDQRSNIGLEKKKLLDNMRTQSFKEIMSKSETNHLLLWKTIMYIFDIFQEQ